MMYTHHIMTDLHTHAQFYLVFVRLFEPGLLLILILLLIFKMVLTIIKNKFIVNLCKCCMF